VASWMAPGYGPVYLFLFI